MELVFNTNDLSVNKTLNGLPMLEPFSLKMYVGSAKTYDFCMLVCFAFTYALLSCLHTYMFSFDIKRANRQKIRK